MKRSCKNIVRCVDPCRVGASEPARGARLAQPFGWPGLGLLGLLAGCAGEPAPLPETCDDYPAGAAEPMAVGEVLSPYRWPIAFHRSDGRQEDVDLSAVPCAGDPDIDWSVFDLLVFVSIPAW